MALLAELLSAIREHSHVILQAEPGAGKSTQVPLVLLQMPQFANQKILMLEPRRLAAKWLAEFLAGQLNEKVGETVGYRVKNDQKISTRTRLEIVTEGVLTRLIQADPELQGIGLVIFDEFHERNLHGDLGLAFLLEIQENLREDLKCLIMSATLDQSALQDFLPAGKFLFCEGRTFPVSVSYHPLPSQTQWYKFPQLPQVLQQALSESSGDILVFLAGAGEIHQAIENCQGVCKAENALSLPLYGALNPAQQDHIFAKSSQRKVIFATNIAETSITLEGITAVIDTGVEKRLSFEPAVGMSRLQTARISKASAAQRMGRAGRVQAGHCYRLWSETQQQSLIDQSLPEICRIDLSGLRMELAAWGATSEELRWLTAPPKTHLFAAENLLQRLGFVDNQGRLTPAGKQSLSVHSEPRFAKLLQVAKQFDVLQLGCDLVALLQEGDLLLERTQVSVDLDIRLDWIWLALTDKTALKRLHRGRWQNFVQSRKRLYQKFALQLADDRNLAKQQSQQVAAGTLLALAFPDRIGKQRGQVGVYKLANGRGVTLPQGDALQSEYIVALEINAQTTQYAQNGRVYLACPLTFSEVMPHLSLSQSVEVEFDTGRQKVVATQRTLLGELCIEQTAVEQVSAQFIEQALLKAVQKNWQLLPITKSVSRFLERAQWLSQFSGFERFSILSVNRLQQEMSWLQPYIGNMNSISQLQNLNLLQILQSQIEYTDLQTIELEAPNSYLSPAGKEFEIDYSGQLAKVSLPLQQVFGELSSPRLANGQVALTFELLSPAQRPIQTTADLANFWRTSYFEVAKEMRGRYPKHRWPEAPLNEKAGVSVKSRA